MSKVSSYGEDTSLTGNEYMYIIDVSGNSKKVKLSTLAQIFAELTPGAQQTLASTVVPKRVTTVTTSASPTPNIDTTDEYFITALATAATFGIPTGTPTDGQVLVIRIKDNGSAQTLTFNAIYRGIGITLPTATTGGQTIYIAAVYNAAATKWDVLSIGRS